MKSFLRKALTITKGIQTDVPTTYVPPSEGTQPKSENILPRALVLRTRGYIEKVTNQFNGCYEQGWFDACAVMMRRLLETLIIECFEVNGIAYKIKDPKTDDFFYLSKLITKLHQEQMWNLGRNVKKALPNLKEMGDLSAHSRRYNAHREDIDKLTHDFRIVCQELIYLAKLK